MKIAITSNHAGFDLKEKLKQAFGTVDWLDLGTDGDASLDYADFGYAVGEANTSQRVNKGIVICGSGIKISTAANRFQMVRAALCTNNVMTCLSRLHNDANVLALGSRIRGRLRLRLHILEYGV